VDKRPPPLLFELEAALVHNDAVKATLESINQMLADGVIRDYAIGGAVGATFYLAPAATVDLDLFVTLPEGSGGLLISLASIYEYLKSRGSTEQDEYIVVKGWPVQFLTPGNALQEEAVSQATPTSVEGIPTRVISAEHLIAIALETGRTKDHIRILHFVEQRAVDRAKLRNILERHGLSAKWSQFEQRFLRGPQ
jgi:hypothetical protein